MCLKFCLGITYAKYRIASNRQTAYNTYITHTLQICRFIYTGKVSHISCESICWISLLNGANKLELYDLVNTIEDYLVNQKETWIRQNMFMVYKFAVSRSEE